MAEGDLTPLPIDPRYARESDCKEREQTTMNKAQEATRLAYGNERRLDGLTGIDGGKGRVGELEHDQRKTSKILDGIITTQAETAKVQEGSKVKQTVIYSAVTVVASGIAIAFIKLVFSQ